MCQACHCPEVSCTDNTAVVTGGVGGVMGLIIFIQSVVIGVILLRQNAKRKANKRSKIQSSCSGKYYLFTPYRTSTEGEHKMVVTSSNEAYGVVTAREEHEYDVIGLRQTQTQHSF